MALKYMDLPLDSHERAAILLQKAMQEVLHYPYQQFVAVTKASLRDQAELICDFYNTDLPENYARWKTERQRMREIEKFKKEYDLGRKKPGEDTRLVTEDCSLYYKTLYRMAAAEMEFRLCLVHSCVEFVEARHRVALRAEKIGRRIALHKCVWPFPMYEPTVARVRRTRPGERKEIEPEFPKKPDIFRDVNDVENLLDDD